MRGNIKQIHGEIIAGSFRALARGITIVENDLDGSEYLLHQISGRPSPPVVGITGPPGAGKSTLVNALLEHWLKLGKKVAVIAVDPSSPFNYGALLGDRVRMSSFYANPGIYIRSLASRGALGGLSAKIIEITSLVCFAPFDIVVVETVGVGQSEVEIAGLADCTIVALVPEAGDEVQTLKAGIMEIADVFVVNKADRDNAEGLYRNLRMMVHEKAGLNREIQVIKTIATDATGVKELADEVNNCLENNKGNVEKKIQLLADKSWQIIQNRRMKDIDYRHLKFALMAAYQDEEFNIYRFVDGLLAGML